MRELVSRWASTEANVELFDENLHLESGPPAIQIERVAARIDAHLVVLGESSRHGMGTALALTAFMSRAVFVAGDERRDGDVIAATDLEAPGYPVVQCAVRVASALGRRVTVVHNVGPHDKIRALVDRVHDLEDIARGFSVVRGTSLSTLPSTAEALDEIASARNADIVVVGVRAGRGHTLAGVLERECARSVLAIPISTEGLTAPS